MVGTGAARFRWRLAYASNGRVLSWLVTSEAQEAMAAYVQATERAGDLPL